MDTLLAGLMGEISRGNEMKVFDWDKAARTIAEYKAQDASAGLMEDWEWTGGTILEDGKFVEEPFMWLASTWATPILMIDGETIPCYIMEHETDWGAKTRWPESARKILDGVH